MAAPRLPNAYPVEVAPPDITPYAAGNTGLPYVQRFEAATPGPSVLIAAIVHGNEPCGAIALDWLLQGDFRPRCGSLTLAFMNHRAYAAFDPADPNATRWIDEDFNRLWGPGRLQEGAATAERDRAREVAGIVADADLLLDLHSFQHPSAPLAMAGWTERGVALARATGLPPRIVTDRGHAAGMRMRDHARFGAEGTVGPAALLIECGQHWAASSAALACETTARFLIQAGLATPDLLERLPSGIPASAPEAQDVFDVTEAITIETDAFHFANPWQGGEILPQAGTLIGQDGDRPITSPYPDCLLVMPSMRLWPGQTAVRLARRR
ncbi:MAG: succinylglutamate desuccinylase/aspartoacylase family protein [Pseudomonadota bacterium]